MNKELQQLKEEFEQRIKELEDKYEPKEEWPKFGDEYWGVNGRGNVGRYRWDGDFIDEEAVEFGNIFKTKAEAEFEAERLKILRELEKLGRPFIVYDDNWSFFLDPDHDIVINPESIHVDKFGSYYFDTEEKAEQALAKIGANNIKKYLFQVED